MPKGYVIIQESIHDPEAMEIYAKTSGAPLVEHGAKLLALDDHYEVLEGEWKGSRVSVIEFESVEMARRWYHSASNRESTRLRQAAADFNMVIASGFVPKDPDSKLV
jgi:uncharacterized protein (DUF1330 family)